MKFNNLKVIIALFFMSFVVNGCYNEMIEATDEYAIQVPFNYASKELGFRTKFDDTIFYNIEKYLTYKDGDRIYGLKEYQDNKSIIKRLEIYQLFVFIDTISGFDPTDVSPETFKTVQTFLKFKSDKESYRIQFLENVNMREFYRQSPDFKPTISTLSKEVSDAISARFIKQEEFQIFSYFTSYEGKRDYVERLDFKVAASLRITLDNGKEDEDDKK